MPGARQPPSDNLDAVPRRRGMVADLKSAAAAIGLQL